MTRETFSRALSGMARFGMVVRGDTVHVANVAAARARFPLDPLIDGSEPIIPLQEGKPDDVRPLPIPSGLAIRVLLVSTLAFAICFAAWLMFGVTGIPIRKELGLNASEFGLLTATPVLTGALFRLPLGIWTDRFGGRIVMFILLVACAVPLWLSSYATALWQFLLLGLALGLVGASFAVGTPYTSRFFPKEKKGLAMGVFGAGTTGAAINMFVAPPLVAAFGWQSVPRVYAVALLVTAALFWLLSAPDPGGPGQRYRSASNSRFCAIPAFGNIANITRLCSADSRQSPSGCRSIS